MAPTVTPAERIRELSQISSDVATMLGSAGQAIDALTNRPINRETGEDTQMTDDSSNTVEAHKEAFKKHTRDYFTGLQGVFVRLRRQALALEDAGIITAESNVLAGAPVRNVPGQPPGGTQGQGQRTEGERIKNGGLGNFDVGWLNSRGNKVGEEKEAELMQEAKELLEDVLARTENGG
ncbi:unnamed protein product [Lecanosticta acicola]|uniref:Mediator of RNA polymerase II transcription subunit 11 n=1 Tax=Lecanosticta acicola TaxID=111012 RepID=A0AAI8Z863_9PEZI|nr:unnamed protein product [Lecanosticta acicola]